MRASHRFLPVVLVGMFVAALLAAPISSFAPMAHSKLPGQSAGAAWGRSGPTGGTVSGSSTNWAGYVVPSGTASVTDVKGSWVQPRFHGSCGGLYNFSAASFWVGIDGWNSNTVEQVGTSVECVSVLYVSAVTYFAWYEFYPAASVAIAMTISPGDHLSGEVRYSTSTSAYTVSIKDVTTGTSYTNSISSITANRSSAEWIAEAPSSSGILPLVDFGSIHFSSSSATISSKTHPVGGFSNVAITMWNSAGTATKATPSALNLVGNAFTVRWNSYGP